MGEEVLSLVTRFIDDRYHAPSADYSDLGPLLASLSAAPASEGTGLAGLLKTIDRAAGKGFDTANPGFAAYIPGGGLYVAALADFIACCVNRYTGIAEPAPLWLRWKPACCGGCATSLACHPRPRACSPPVARWRTCRR